MDLADYTPKQFEDAKEELIRKYGAEDDPAKKVVFGEQLEQLERYLATSKDIYGRPRKFADPLDKARKRVSSAIGTALKNIECYHKELGLHLRDAIRTGGECSYRPATDITWQS